MKQNSSDNIYANSTDGWSLAGGSTGSIRQLRLRGGDVTIDGNGLGGTVIFPSGTITVLSNGNFEYNNFTSKPTGTTSDIISIEDASASFAKRQMSLAGLFGTVPINNARNYTPIATNVTNVASSSVTANWHFWVFGDLIVVAGSYAMAPTTANIQTRISFSIPVASAFAATHDCVGAAANASEAGSACMIRADTVADRIDVFNFPTVTTSRTYHIIAVYQRK